jgi:hypothetical protein
MTKVAGRGRQDGSAAEGVRRGRRHCSSCLQQLACSPSRDAQHRGRRRLGAGEEEEWS